jgi:O-antigen ligase
LNPLNRLLESVQPRRSFEADWQRAHDLQLSKRLLAHDPLTGYGMENINAIEPPTKIAFHLPHFILLQSWVAGGVVALLGTLWLYVATLWLGWRAVREGHVMAIGLVASCVSFILMDMVAPALDQRFKWFAAALLFATLLKSGQSSQPAAIPPSTA